MTEQELLDQPKERVIERQFNNNCDYGFKQPNVKKFIRMAFESGFENGMNYQKFSNHPDTSSIELRELREIVGLSIQDAKNKYEAECDSVDWYNNNMPGVGITLDFQSRPSKPKILELAGKVLNQ